MIKRIFFAGVASLLFTTIVFSQELLSNHKNHVDARGLKQGNWKAYDERGNLKFTGQFKDNIPYGEFKYYYPEGETKAVSLISDDGRIAYTKAYHKNGYLMAEGKYLDRKKDSTWNYYSEFDKNMLMAVEYYENTQKKGVWVKYYPNGSLAEEVTYDNDGENGLWKQYFSDGKVKLKAIYENGKLEGLMTIYYPNGGVNISGSYKSGMKEGIWIYFNERAQKTKREEYSGGYLMHTETYIDEPE